MAIDAAKLAVRISAEGVDQTSRQLRNLGLQIDSTGNQAKRSATGHDAMARSTQNAGRQSQQATGAVAGMASTLGRVNAGSVIAAAGIAGIGVAAAGAARGAIQAGIDFESAFAGVQKTVSATDAQFDVLERGIRDMALEVPIAATEIARIGEAAGQLGVAQGDILEFSRTMADLGVATNLTSEQAATALAQFSNITGAAISDVDNISSALVSLGNSSATTESQILDLALRLAGAGTTIGLTEEQILGISAALSSLGLRSESAGTSFSAVFLEIEKAVDMAGERLEIFSSIAGMTADQFTQVWSTAPDQALSAFIEGIAAFEQAGGNVSLLFEDLELGGIRVGDSLRRAAGGGDLLRSSMEQSTDAARENVALTEEAARRYETTASKLTLLGNQAKEAAISGFDILGPAIGASAEMLGEFLVSIPPAIEGLSDFIEVVQEMREADVSERTGLEGFLADIIELGSDANDVLNDLNAAINDLPTVVPLFDMKESNVSDVERNAEALLAAYEEVMGISIVRTGDAVDSLIAWETHTGISFATVDDIYRRYIGTTKEVYEANQEMLSGLSSGIDGSGQTGLDNLSADLLAVQSTWTDTARMIRDEQQALGNGFQEFSTSAEAGFTQSTASYSRFITAFSGNTDTALSSFDALTQSIATGAIDFEQAASLYANIPRDQLVPAVTEAAAELRGKLADATLSEMDARAIEGQVNALKQIFPDLVAEIDGVAGAFGNFGSIQDVFQANISDAAAGVSEWEGHLSGAERALGFLQEKIDAGIPLTAEQQQQYDDLSVAVERYKGGIDDEAEALIDAEIAKADFIARQDELNQALADGTINQEEYDKAIAEAAEGLDPFTAGQMDLVEATKEVIEQIRDFMIELGLIEPPPPVELEVDEEDAYLTLDEFAEKYGTMPDPPPTVVSVDDEDALLSLNDYIKKQDEIDGSIHTDVTADTLSANTDVDALLSKIRGGATMPVAVVMSGGGGGLTAFADGGISQGGLALVGEEGPEFVILPKGAEVIPNPETMAMMNGGLPFLGGFADGTGGNIGGGVSVNVGAFNWDWLFAGLEAAAAHYSEEALKHINSFVSTASSSLSLLQDTMALHDAANAFEGFAPPETLTGLVENSATITRQVGESAAMFEEEFLTSASEYASSASAGVGLLNDAADLMATLSTATFNLDRAKEAASTLKFLIEHITLSIGDTAAYVGAERSDGFVAQADLFSQSSTSGMDLMSAGADVLSALADLPAVYDLDSAREAATNLKFLIEHIVLSIGDTAAYVSSQRADGFVQQAGVFSESAQQAVELTAAGLGFISELADFDGTFDLASSSEWASGLKFLVEHIALSIGDSAAYLQQERPEEFLAGMESYAASVGPALSILNDMVGLLDSVAGMTASTTSDAELRDIFARLAELAADATASAQAASSQWSTETNPALEAFASDVGNALGILNDTFGILKMGGLNPDAMQGNFDDAFAFLVDLAVMAANAAATASAEWETIANPALEAFAEDANNSLGVMTNAGSAIGAILAFGEIGSGDDTRRRSDIRKLADEMLANVEYVIARIDEMADTYGGDGLEAAAEFAVAASDTLGLIEAGSGAFEAIVGQSVITKAATQRFKSNFEIVLDMVRELNTISQDYIADAMSFQHAMELIAGAMQAAASAMDAVTGSSSGSGQGSSTSNITQVAPGQWVSGPANNAATTVGARPMATGGVVTQPLLALVGERGPEMVQPLSANAPERAAFIRDVAAEVARTMAFTNITNVNIDGEPVAESANKVNTKKLATNMGPI